MIEAFPVNYRYIYRIHSIRFSSTVVLKDDDDEVSLGMDMVSATHDNYVFIISSKKTLVPVITEKISILHLIIKFK